MEWFKKNKKETEHVRETVKGLNDRSFQIPAKGVVNPAAGYSAISAWNL